jgi:hypothetical protein
MTLQMRVQAFNAGIPVQLQLNDYSCSVGATFWCLQSIGWPMTQQDLENLMVPALVSTDLGLLDSSGAGIAQLLRDQFGLAATNAAQVSFDDVAQRAGQQPIAIGGRSWYVDPSGNVIGHWVAVRGFDGTQLLLANPGGSGPNFGQQALDRNAFQQRGTFAAVWIDLPAGSTASSGASAPSGHKFRIGNTGGQGANLRSQPSASSAVVAPLADGAEVTSTDEHAWRQVTDANGNQGWVAAEFLTAES